eukprot:9481893-Pyramimonas_sp.AAC.1
MSAIAHEARWRQRRACFVQLPSDAISSCTASPASAARSSGCIFKSAPAPPTMSQWECEAGGGTSSSQNVKSPRVNTGSSMCAPSSKISNGISGSRRASKTSGRSQ